MKALRTIKDPVKHQMTKEYVGIKIIARDRLCDIFGVVIECNIVDALTSDVVINVKDIFLMGLWCQDNRAEQSAAKDLTNLLD